MKEKWNNDENDGDDDEGRSRKNSINLVHLADGHRPVVLKAPKHFPRAPKHFPG
jgi:hypothetical protein